MFWVSLFLIIFFSLAPQLIVVEDTHLTLAVILFKVGASYSFTITNIREKIYQVSIPVQPIIP